MAGVRFCITLLSAVLLPATTLAHADISHGRGVVAGFLHPFSGLDHVVAMLAVGLWGAVLDPAALWVLPVAFLLVMAFGGLLGLLGVPIPGVEIGIALSGLAMGLLVLVAPAQAHAPGTGLGPAIDGVAWLLETPSDLLVATALVALQHQQPAPIHRPTWLLSLPMPLAWTAAALIAQALPLLRGPWGAITLRIGGSWIAAASLLMLGWQLRHPQ
jgi:urease accessory protein